MKRFFFTKKNMKKITEKYNSYQRNARLIHILPVLVCFCADSFKKKKAVQSTDMQTHRRIGWKMILWSCRHVILLHGPNMCSRHPFLGSWTQSKGSWSSRRSVLQFLLIPLSRHPHQTLPSLGCSSLPPCPALQGPSGFPSGPLSYTWQHRD